MTRLAIFIGRRLLVTIFLVYFVATLVFLLARASPYDPVVNAIGSTEFLNKTSIAAMRHTFGLDQPLWRQYVNYISGLPHLNFGYSEAQSSLGQPVWTLIRDGVPVSFRLGLFALILALIIGLPIGTVSALRQNTAIDHVGQTGVMLLHAIPVFVTAPLAQLIFGVYLGWLPVNGWGSPGIDGYKQMVLPVVIYGIALAAYYARVSRAFLLEVLRQDYIRTARSKGLKYRRILIVHTMKNALVPFISVLGPSIAFLVAGAFIIESFFSIPGIGNITVTAVQVSNYPVIEATAILIAALIMIVNMLTDIIVSFIDPRLRL
jgi:ABC-type dipeptide/oligopeptide/nickel transport system permease component